MSSLCSSNFGGTGAPFGIVAPVRVVFEDPGVFSLPDLSDPLPVPFNLAFVPWGEADDPEGLVEPAGLFGFAKGDKAVEVEGRIPDGLALPDFCPDIKRQRKSPKRSRNNNKRRTLRSVRFIE